MRDIIAFACYNESNPWEEVYIMAALNTILNIVLIISSIALIAVVLMQQTKSSGLGGAFGGDTQSFTARGQAASKEAKLQKITKILAIVIAVIAIAMTIIN